MISTPVQSYTFYFFYVLFCLSKKVPKKDTFPEASPLPTPRHANDFSAETENLLPSPTSLPCCKTFKVSFTQPRQKSLPHTLQEKSINTVNLLGLRFLKLLIFLFPRPREKHLPWSKVEVLSLIIIFFSSTFDPVF